MSVDELKGDAATAATSRRIIFSSIAFVLGFATVFVALGATASVIGQTIAQYFDTLAIIAGVIIIIMGLHFLGVFRIGLLFREARVQVQRKPAGLVGAYIIGLAFAFGWTPCVGPVLAAILFMAGTTNPAQGSLLLLVYALGIGLPLYPRGRIRQPVPRLGKPFPQAYGNRRKDHGRFSRPDRPSLHHGKDVGNILLVIGNLPAFSQVG